MERADSAEFWDREADAYAAGRTPSAVDRATLAAAPPVGDVLEIGAGPGVVTRQILAAGPSGTLAAPEGPSVGRSTAAREPAPPDRSLAPGSPKPSRIASCESAGSGPEDPQLVYTLVATDISPRFVARLRALHDPRLTVLLADHRALRFPDESFDVIYAMATLHHLRPAERLDMLAAIRGWLRPEARFVLVEDWAFTPADEVQTRLLRLRAALREREDPDEVHPTEGAWTDLAGRAGLRQVAAHRAPRREDLRRYAPLCDDPACRADLDWLHEHAPLPEIPMSILLYSR